MMCASENDLSMIFLYFSNALLPDRSIGIKPFFMIQIASGFAMIVTPMLAVTAICASIAELNL
jgi:hypothetical protein